MAVDTEPRGSEGRLRSEGVLRALHRATVRWLASPEASVVLLVAAWSAGLETVALLGSAFVHHAAQPGQSAISIAWQQMDGNWYDRIVAIGYHAWPDPTPHGSYYLQAAFFPGFPLIARGVYDVLQPIGVGSAGAMIITNQLLVFALAILLYRLAVALTDDRAAALRTVRYLLVFPFAYFLLAPFSEAAFLTWMAGFSWALVTRRYLLAGMFAGLASGTRLVGIVLPLILIIGYLEHHGWRLRSLRPRVFIAAALGLTGAIGFAIYQWMLFGSPTYSETASNFGWGRTFSLNFWKPIAETFDHHLSAGYLLGWPLEVFEVIPLLAAFLVLAILVWRRFGPALGLTCVLLLTVPLTSNSTLSFNRYVLPLLPCFVILGQWGRHKAFDIVYTTLGAALLTVFLMMFTHGVWTG